MRIDVKDLVETFKGNGEPFENLMNDLVRAIARSCGMDDTQIHWDHRTTLKDGGRDLVIDAPNLRTDKPFLPSRASIWSMKSGDEGISPSALKKEITSEKHPKIRSALENGSAYVWCTVWPATHDKVDDMKNAGSEVVSELGLSADQIQFRWADQIREQINLYPNVISIHLPQIGFTFAEVITLEQWKRERGMANAWVNFGTREEVVRRVTNHLLGQQPPNVLHIAGLSGIGKTRTVLEGCSRHPNLAGVFYVGRYEQVNLTLRRYLEVEGRHVLLVIDETPFEKVEEIISRFGEYSDRLRVVSMGPAVRQSSRVSRDEILILPEPEGESEILQVIRTTGAGLREEVLDSIAGQCRHDLRLALLLVQAARRLPQFGGVAVDGIDGIWERVTGLFAQEIGNYHDFRKFYEVLTASVDVGMADNDGREIKILAEYFEHPEQHVRDAANISERCGLGIRAGRFFEATPRALAARLFMERVWPRVRDNLNKFFLSLPERLQRRFLERCQDCSGSVREEVMAKLGQFFLSALSGGDVTVLASRVDSRLFQTWAEFDPERGLAWLRQAVERASAEQLLALDGENDGTGGWRGRRQLVWLCQNLASFAEHFDNCEAILFRLALHETEPSIGNNSTIIWGGLFWPVLAAVEVPFLARLPILLRRLCQCSEVELPLVVNAAIGCVEYRGIGLPIPPRIVGGRVVPVPWRPATYEELARLRRDAATQILAVINNFSHEKLRQVQDMLTEHLQTVIGLGLLENLRAVFQREPLVEPVRQNLLAKLEHKVSFFKETNEENRNDAVIKRLEEWILELSPQDLESRARDLTAQDYWITAPYGDRDVRYNQLADELISNPETFRRLAAWFGSTEARSASALGFALGRRDVGGNLGKVVGEWLQTDLGRPVVIMYLQGTAARVGNLPDAWSSLLDGLAISRPELVGVATCQADVSIRGFNRLLSILDSLPTPRSRYLRQMAFGPWLHTLGPDERRRALETLIRLADLGDVEAVSAGTDLIRMWRDIDKDAVDQTLAQLALRLVQRPLSTVSYDTAYSWLEVMELLCPFFPREAARIILEVITSPDGTGRAVDDRNIEVLALAARHDPSAVMEEFGNAILDPKRKGIFGILVCRGLFGVIGPRYVATWIQQHGRDNLRWLARHFPAPYLDENKQPKLAPLTEWFFREYENDEEAFRWFLMGCGSTGFRSQDEVDPIKKRAEMQPFLTHELRRVREWAQNEIESEER